MSIRMRICRTAPSLSLMMVLGLAPGPAHAEEAPSTKQLSTEASQANWPDVIAAYVTDRAKKQVALSIIEDLKDRLEKYTIMATLFPETSAFLKALGPSWISDEGADRIRRKLIADFTNLPVLIMDLKKGVGSGHESADRTPLKYRKPEIAFAYALYAGMLKVHVNDRDFSHFVGGAREAMDRLVKHLENDATTPGYDADQVEAAGMYFQAFQAALTRLEQIANDPDERSAFQALSKKDIFKDLDSAKAALDLYVEKAYDCMRVAIRELEKGYRIEEDLSALETLEEDLLRKKAQKMAIPETAMHEKNVLGKRIADNKAMIQSISFLCETTFEIYEYITRRDYRNAALSAILLARKTEVLTDKRWGRWIHMAGSFSSADTAQEKYDFIDSITDPISDYLNKRNLVGWEPYLGINAYLGGRYAYEDVRHSDQSDTVMGLSAPVGLEFGIGTGCDWMPYIGILGFPIDVGKPATARLRSSDIDGNNIEDQGTTWEEIVSPGAQLVFALTRRYPVTLGIGAQYTPRIEVDGATGYSSWQYGVTLGIDVPLLRLR